MAGSGGRLDRRPSRGQDLPGWRLDQSSSLAKHLVQLAAVPFCGGGGNDRWETDRLEPAAFTSVTRQTPVKQAAPAAKIVWGLRCITTGKRSLPLETHPFLFISSPNLCSRCSVDASRQRPLSFPTTQPNHIRPGFQFFRSAIQGEPRRIRPKRPL